MGQEVMEARRRRSRPSNRRDRPRFLSPYLPAISFPAASVASDFDFLSSVGSVQEWLSDKLFHLWHGVG